MRSEQIVKWIKEKSFPVNNEGKQIPDEQFMEEHIKDIQLNFPMVYIPCSYSCFYDLDDFVSTRLIERREDIISEHLSSITGQETYSFHIPDLARDIIDKHIDNFVTDGNFVFAPELSENALPFIKKGNVFYKFSSMLQELREDLKQEKLDIELHPFESEPYEYEPVSIHLDMAELFGSFSKDIMVSDDYETVMLLTKDAKNISLATELSRFTGSNRLEILQKIRYGDIEPLKESVRRTIDDIAAEDSGYITSDLWSKHEMLLTELEDLKEKEEELTL